MRHARKGYSRVNDRPSLYQACQHMVEVLDGLGPESRDIDEAFADLVQAVEFIKKVTHSENDWSKN